MDEFVRKLAARADLGFPVFSVSDCNSFHTSGYLWGHYAALKLKAAQKLKAAHKTEPEGAIAVVNFDHHLDLKSPKKYDPDPNSRDEHEKLDGVASDRWGTPCVYAMNKLGYDAFYISLDGSGITGCFGRSRDGKKAFPTESGKNPKIWQNVQKTLGNIEHVFVTVDRDVLKNSYTQWGDGHVATCAALLEFMSETLEPLFPSLKPQMEVVAKGDVENTMDKRTARLIGFDVTGLPEAADVIPKPGSGLLAVGTVWQRLNAELLALREFADKLPRFAKSPFSNVVFYSGSVSYTGPILAGTKSWNCWDFIFRIASGLAGDQKGLISEGVWKYLLCRKEPPVYSHGWKPFALYKPSSPVTSDITEGISETNRWKKRERIDKVRTLLVDGEYIGGFAATAAVVSGDTAVKQGASGRVSLDDLFKKTGDFEESRPKD
jgi:hypothetical protein